MRIAFYGSSLLSSYWNGAATYYRGLLQALAEQGHRITFYEPDVYDRQKNRDIEPPDWCEVVVYDGTMAALHAAAARAADADIVVKTSGVGFEDEALLDAVMAAARPGATRIFWDVDAPATLAEMRGDAAHPLRRALPDLDAVMTYGGGAPVVDAYIALGARACVPIYNALDPATHHPVPPEPEFAADLNFLGNRLPDREERVERFFFEPALRLPGAHFLLGGSGWQDKPMPGNVSYIGHVPTISHNAFNSSAKAVLNVNRASMAETGFSPPTRIFEAAGAAACLITDAWTGLGQFLDEGEEVLVARDGDDVVEIMRGLTRERAAGIGERARQRVLRDHTYARRAEQAAAVFRDLRARREAMV
ncbi:CgeB family protein [Roseitranquillus sediminis]|uniref:CgeB family protein n=1 Tax=Roseitranquillus sediminis TaxID=2809051 RepID=UPI001D0C1189|nr:glycosyltransferase [Roseitranquillus sediminis]MBM9593378.1 glycosyltransferase [Roseitranquillus sediminis]